MMSVGDEATLERFTRKTWAMYVSPVVLVSLFAYFAYLGSISPATKQNSDLPRFAATRRRNEQGHDDIPRPTPSDEHGDDDILRGCSSILFDLGAKKGTHVRKLFEPHKYPDAKVLKTYDKVFGDPALRRERSSKTGLCAYGFEANPAHQEALQAIEKHYTRMGWSVKMIVPRIVSTVDDKEVTLYDVSWGTSTIRVFRGAQHVSVRTLDFPSFLRRALAARSNGVPGQVLLKMDIEGSEFEVLPVLLENGDLCTGRIDQLMAEFHPEMRKDVSESITTAVLGHKCGGFQVSSLDDESYLNDGKPLP